MRRLSRKHATAIVLTAVVVTVGVCWSVWHGTREQGQSGTHEPLASGADVVEPELLQPILAESLRKRISERDGAQLPETPTSPPANLSAPENVLIRLQTVDGLAIPGARVEWVAPTESIVRATDARGVCTFSVGATVTTLSLRVDAAGFLHVRANYRADPMTEITLHRTVPLVGRVLDATDRTAVSRAVISLIHGNCRGCPAEVTETDWAGEFRFAAIPEDLPVPLEVTATGYARSGRMIEPSDRAKGIELLLQPGVETLIVVCDIDSRQPIAGADVWTRWESGSADSQTDSAGRIRTRVVPGAGDAVDVEVMARGYCCVRFHAKAAELGRLEIPLLRGGHIRGRVTDSAGAPVTGAIVVIQTLPQDVRRLMHDRAPPFSFYPAGWRLEGEWPDRSTTDERGWFESHGLLPWTDVQLVVLGEGGQSERRIERLRAPAPGMTTEIELHL